MKINIITDYNGRGLSQEADILAKQLFRIFKNRITINKVNHFQYKAPHADINILLEVVPNVLLSYARMNILIPDQELFYKSAWEPYLSKIDLILTKSRYAERLFKEFCRVDCRYLGMTSVDRYDVAFESPSPSLKFLHIAGVSTVKGTIVMLKNWKPTYPPLKVVVSAPSILEYIDANECGKQANISYVKERITNEEVTRLMNEYKFHVCCSSEEGFGHYINEARSTGGIVITTNGDPMRIFVDHGESGFLVAVKNKKYHATGLGYTYHIDEADFRTTIENVMLLSEDKINMMSKASRALYGKDKVVFKTNLETIMMSVFKEYTAKFPVSLDDYLKSVRLYKGELSANLPGVTIVTLTYNRKYLFPLAIRNILETLYPRDKIEWIVVDDSDNGDDLEDMLMNSDELDDINVSYLKNNSRKCSIAEKRNKAIKLASNDIIVFMDDDDYYPPNSVKQRVLELLTSKKECVLCTTIGCYDIMKNSSIINQPPLILGLEERVSEATLCFYKSFWSSQPFSNRDSGSGSEGEAFLVNRVDSCSEISWEGIIVSIIHGKNTSSRKLPEMSEPNGNHFGWDDELFKFIHSLFDNE
jgi:glycosyltransferase involved in cell wall biosynthesis